MIVSALVVSTAYENFCNCSRKQITNDVYLKQMQLQTLPKFMSNPKILSGENSNHAYLRISIRNLDPCGYDSCWIGYEQSSKMSNLESN